MATDYQLEEISIELTNKCLMNCIMCSSGSSIKSSNALKMQDVLRLLKEARDLGATIFSMSGGEPALAKSNDTTSYTMVAKKLGYKRVLLYTTGITSMRACTDPMSARVLADREVGLATPLQHYELITQHRFYWETLAGYNDDSMEVRVIFPIHSHIRTVHDYIMGRSGSWSAIVANIIAAKAAGLPVEVHMVPMLPNWNDMITLRWFLKHLDVDSMSLLRFVPQTRGFNNKGILAINHRTFTIMQSKMNRMLVETDPVIPTRLGCPIDFRHAVFPEIAEKQHPCHAGKDLILVRSDGDAHPCAAWKSLPHSDNIHRSCLKDIWDDSKVFNAVRDFQESGYTSVCISCTYKDSCKSGCIAQRLHHHLANTGSVDLSVLTQNFPDPLCPLL